MMMINRIRISFLALALMVFAFPMQAAQVRVAFSSVDSMDAAGQNLRQALNAWYGARDQALPSSWTRLTIAKGESVSFGRDYFLLLQDSNSAEAKMMAIGPDGPVTGHLRLGSDEELGAFRVLLIETNEFSAQVLYRGTAGDSKLLSDAAHPGSSAIIIEGYEEQTEILVIGSDQRALDFAAVFLRAVADGKSATNASQGGFAIVPPKPVVASVSTAPSIPGPRPLAYAEEFDEPWSAMVTFRVIRGSSSSLQQLRGSIDYKNSGNTNDLPVSASGGPDGGTVTVGSYNDRFRATLSALEKSRSVSVNSESFIRVPLGGEGFFQFQGINGIMSGNVFTRRVGRDGVELSFDQESGDWGSFGVTSSRLRFRNGQTIEAARSTSSRTTSSRSGPPIIQDIPFIGAGVGSSSSSSTDESYALYITVDVE